MTAVKDLTTTEIVRYGNFQFGKPASLGDQMDGQLSGNPFPPKIKLASEYVYDDADRVITHVKYTLTVEAIIYAGSELSESQDMTLIEEELSKPGKELILEGIGLGDIRTRSAVTRTGQRNDRDVIWGVKPQSARFTSLGGFRAWELEWICEFNITVGASASAFSGALFLALNYKSSWSFDTAGYATRVIEGSYKVPQEAGGPNARFNKNNFTADSMRDSISIRIPHGYKRVGHNWSESADRTSMTFQILDEEIHGEAPPPGIVEWDVEQNISNISIGFTRWKLTFSGTIETAPGYPRELAGERFIRYVLDKITVFKRANMDAPARSQMLVIPETINISHRDRTRKTRMVIGFIATTCIKNLFGEGVIWDEPLRDGWTPWAKSLQENWSTRGFSRTQPTKGSDILVDLRDKPTGFAEIGHTVNRPKRVVSSIRLPFDCEVTKEDSYLAYDVEIRLFQKQNAVVHTLSRLYTPAKIAARAHFDTIDKVAVAGLGEPYELAKLSASEKLEDVTAQIVNYVAPPENRVVLRGKLLRLGFRPVAPSLISIGGQELVQLDERSSLKLWGNFFGCPLYLMTFVKVYIAPKGYIGPYDAKSTPELCAIEDDKGEITKAKQ